MKKGGDDRLWTGASGERKEAERERNGRDGKREGEGKSFTKCAID